MAQALKSATELYEEMRPFSIQKFSVLVDDSIDQEMIAAIPQEGLEGYYSFTAAMSGQKIGDRIVELLPTADQSLASQAWLLATRSKAGYALNEFLRQRQQEDKIVFTLSRDHISAMYSYVDFFHGETTTIAYVTNNFERGYKIHFPIALRFLLRSQSGEVLQSSQRLIAPNQTVTFDSRELGLTAPFVGYLELYTDVRHLNGEVTPFLHFNCDYISADGVATIHQSGFKPWPAGSRFVRGIVPNDGQNQLTISLFNKTNDGPIACQAELRFTRDGKRMTVARDLPSVPKDHMVFVNINEMFSDELERRAEGADVVVVADKPMHRPNFYLHPINSRWGWTAVEHGAALVEHVLSSDQCRRLVAASLRPWVCAFPILPKRFEIDTLIMYFQDGVAELHDFTFELFDQAGAKLHSEDVHCEFGQCINISDWARHRSLSLDGGLLNISPSLTAAQVPHSFSFLEGFKHVQNPHFSIGICGGAMMNIPFEWERSWMWNHPMVPTVHTEQFGKAVIDDESDTIVTLYNSSAINDYDQEANFDLDIYAADGEMARFRKTIAPNSSITFSVGDLVCGSDLPKQGHYAIWVYCRNRYIYGFHILQRRKDHAIGAQHFYYCRFNMLERDLPHQQEIVLPNEKPPERTTATLIAHAIVDKAQRTIRQFM
jgi:hypothetical protein